MASLPGSRGLGGTRLALRGRDDHPCPAAPHRPALRRPPVCLQLGAGAGQGEPGCPGSRSVGIAAGLDAADPSQGLEQGQGRGRAVVAVLLQGGLRLRDRHPSQPDARCGIDLGIGREWAIIAHSDDTIERVAHPAPWVETQAGGPGPACGQAAPRVRSHPDDRAGSSLQHDRGRGPRRGRDGQGHGPSRVPAERLPSRNRSGPPDPGLQDQLGGQLVVADRWLASSKTHGCGGYHADLRLADRVWVCPACRQLVDRNANAARNLRDWTGPVSDRDVQRGGVAAPVPLVGDHDGQAHAPGVGVRGPVRPPHVAGADDTSTNPPTPGARNPAPGYHPVSSHRRSPDW